MHKSLKHFMHSTLLLLLTFLFLCLIGPVTALASDYEDTYTFDFVWCNPETGYEVYIDDWADLLTSTQEAELLETMKEITEYGHVSFVSIDDNPI